VVSLVFEVIIIFASISRNILKYTLETKCCPSSIRMLVSDWLRDEPRDHLTFPHVLSIIIFKLVLGPLLRSWELSCPRLATRGRPTTPPTKQRQVHTEEEEEKEEEEDLK